MDDEVVEQRILEQETRMPGYGAVTAWASLRWQGAAYFDGRSRSGEERLPIPLALGEHMIRGDDRVAIRRGQLGALECLVVDGLRCTTWERALYDEIVRIGSLRPAVTAFDMTLAAGLATHAGFWAYLDRVRPRNGVVLARKVTALARDDVWSPQETAMRLCWTMDAGLPEPACNTPVFDLHGNLIGIPDLFDAEAGVVGEYQGAIHRGADRHRRDVRRAERFRDHGLEYFEVVSGDLNDPRTATMMRRVRARARFAPVDERAWTLEAPSWWRDRHEPRAS